ncbi:MAG: aldo/keto reductase [Alphaproteobacteria bacterium]|nr:aldo/keto reductase [Alphaproteobacteria bacterium]
MAAHTIPEKRLKTGFALPVLGLGTWMMGGDHAHDPNANMAAEVKALQQGIELGFRHIDTAEVYAAGFSETIVADAIRPYRREDLVLASKVGPKNHNYDALLSSLKASLERLKTPYLDIYYLHAPNLDVPLQETARALNVAVADGLIKHIAVSNFHPDRIDRLREYLQTPIVANQVHYNLAFREPETVGMLKHAQERDYFIVAWRPIRFANRKAVPGTGLKNAWEPGAYPVLDQVAAETGKSNIQVALNWLFAQPQTVALVKSSKADHLAEICGACGWQLTEAQRRTLSRDFLPQYETSDTIPLV